MKLYWKKIQMILGIKSNQIVISKLIFFVVFVFIYKSIIIVINFKKFCLHFLKACLVSFFAIKFFVIVEDKSTDFYSQFSEEDFKRDINER